MKAALLALALALSGCGYRLVGGGGAPARPVHVGSVADESGEPLFGASLRAALARQVVDRPEAALGSPGGAGVWRLSATALSAQETAVAYVAGDRPRLYLLAAEADARLEAPDGRVVWKGLRLRAEREFVAGDTVEQTKVQKNAALRLLAEDLAREVLRRVALVTDGGA